MIIWLARIVNDSAFGLVALLEVVVHYFNLDVQVAVQVAVQHESGHRRGP